MAVFDVVIDYVLPWGNMGRYSRDIGRFNQGDILETHNLEFYHKIQALLSPDIGTSNDLFLRFSSKERSVL